MSRCHRLALTLGLVFLTGCPDDPIADDDDTTDPGDDDDSTGTVDADGDGFDESSDCDDGDPLSWPGAPELCDGVDNDCDGNVPADETEDLDGDGVVACGDCDDGDPEVHPDQVEQVNCEDDDCDGMIDEWTAAADDDRDGFCEGVDLGEGLQCCDGTEPGDCDDASPLVHPGAPPVCDHPIDNDCDGAVDDNDADADVDGLSLCGGDCDDADPLLTHHGDRATLRVPEDHETIQAAIDAAEDCDLILVGAGSYDGLLEFDGKAIRVTAVDGPEHTTVWGGTFGVRFSDGESVSSVLEGFRIVGADQGVIIEGASPLLRGVAIEHNGPAQGTLAAGAGLYMSDARPWILTSSINHNEAWGYDKGGHCASKGGGVYMVDSRPVLEHVEVLGNQACLGAGVGMLNSVAYLTDVVVRGNAAGNEGGGVYLEGSTSWIDNSRITGNTTTFGEWGAYGGGLSLIGDSAVTLRNVLLGDNGISGEPWYDATAQGGGIFVGSQSECGLQGSAIVGNHTGDGPPAGVGGGVYLEAGASLRAENTVFAHNSASSGAGLHGGGASLALSHMVFFGNGDGYVGGHVVGQPWEVEVVDPRWIDLTDPSAHLWDLHLSTDSPLIDAGEAGAPDPDGSRSDIGPYGGPRGGRWDLDHDGFPEWWQPGEYEYDSYPFDGWDCDDRDIEVFPGQGC